MGVPLLKPQICVLISLICGVKKSPSESFHFIKSLWVIILMQKQLMTR